MSNVTTTLEGVHMFAEIYHRMALTIYLTPPILVLNCTHCLS